MVVMELMTGGSLHDLLFGGPLGETPLNPGLGIARALDMALDMARGLHYFHARQVGLVKIVFVFHSRFKSLL